MTVNSSLVRAVKTLLYSIETLFSKRGDCFGNHRGIMYMEVPMNKITTTEYAMKAQTTLWKDGMTTRIVGWGEPPPLPYYQKGMRLDEFLKSDLESTTLMEVLRRLNELDERNIKYSRIMIAHELPKEAPPKPQISKKVLEGVSD